MSNRVLTFASHSQTMIRALLIHCRDLYTMLGPCRGRSHHWPALSRFFSRFSRPISQLGLESLTITYPHARSQSTLHNCSGHLDDFARWYIKTSMMTARVVFLNDGRISLDEKRAAAAAESDDRSPSFVINNGDTNDYGTPRSFSRAKSMLDPHRLEN